MFNNLRLSNVFTYLLTYLLKSDQIDVNQSSSSSSSCVFFLSRRLTSQGIPNCPVLCSSFQLNQSLYCNLKFQLTFNTLADSHLALPQICQYCAKSKTRNSSADEIANVNFLYDDIVHALKCNRLLHKFRHRSLSATQVYQIQ